MTTELEKQFFETFEIEERCETDKHCCNWLCDSYHYPQITDRHYLELLCIFHNSPICLGGVNLGSVELLKERLLASFIQTMNMNVHQARKDELKHQVQELFKGE